MPFDLEEDDEDLLSLRLVDPLRGMVCVGLVFFLLTATEKKKASRTRSR